MAEQEAERAESKQNSSCRLRHDDEYLWTSVGDGIIRAGGERCILTVLEDGEIKAASLDAVDL